LTAAGRAAVLVPLPTAADDHQRKNAEVLARAGAADVMDQKDLSGAVLAGRIVQLVANSAQRDAMAAAARKMGRPDAAKVIADKALELVNERRR
jgi:UDP-N-acetylglucosamine--N-acetylmuramyl-(pentapeptide) pyrophosphoryl-undecaprenol N-acetylglucosamine transferase